MSIELYPNIAKVKRNGSYQNLPGFVQQSGDADIEAMIANKETSTTAQFAHAKDSFFILNDVLYQADTNISVNGTIAVGTNCHVSVIGDEILELINGTTSQSQAINELKTAITPIEYFPLEQGGLAGVSSVTEVVTAKRVRTVGYVYGNVTITCNTGIIVTRVYYFNKATGAITSLVEPSTNSYKLQNGNDKCARIVFAKSDTNATITVEDVKINTIFETIIKEQDNLTLDNLPLEQGGITTSGELGNSTTRIRTSTYIKGKFTLKIPEGIILFRVFYYNSSTFAFDSYVEYSTYQDKVTVYKSGCVSKLVFSNGDNTITPSDITRFTNSIPAQIESLKNSTTIANNKVDSFYQDTDKLFAIEGQLFYGETGSGLGGFINESNSLITSYYIPVTSGEKVTVKGRGSDAATALVCFYDANYYLVSSVKGSSYDNKNVTLTVPSGAVFMRVCKEKNKTGLIDCLATRRINDFSEKAIKAQFNYHEYSMPSQTALPDELLATSGSFVQANVPDYVYGLYDELVSDYPNYVSKVNLNEVTEIGTSSEYPLFMYKLTPPTVKASNGSSSTEEHLKKVLLISGAHPELAGVYGLYLVAKHICENGNDDNLVSLLRYSYEIDIIPIVNPYGLANGVSVDENGVDFERNFHTQDWSKAGASGTKGYTGDTYLSENNSQIVTYLFENGGYTAFANCHNFYESQGRGLSWVVPPMSPEYRKQLYDVGCNHIKSMTALWKKEFSTTFPEDDYVYGFVTIPLENMRSGTGYVGLPCRAASHYGIKALTIESCETCNYINGEYAPANYVRGTADVMTRVAENIINIIMTLLI